MGLSRGDADRLLVGLVRTASSDRELGGYVVAGLGRSDLMKLLAAAVGQLSGLCEAWADDNDTCIECFYNSVLADMEGF